MEGQSIPNYFSQQQYVWVPVPVMSLPAVPITAKAQQGSQSVGDFDNKNTLRRADLDESNSL